MCWIPWHANFCVMEIGLNICFSKGHLCSCMCFISKPIQFH